MNASTPEQGHRCSCGFESEALCALEDHLFVFPEDDHYELAKDWPRGVNPEAG